MYNLVQQGRKKQWGAIGNRLPTVQHTDHLCTDIFQVDNCDKLTKPRVVLPNLKTEEPVCPDNQLQCGNGECIDKILFCDNKPDCSDGSDEVSCTVDEDPNAAAKCDPRECVIPDCFCSVDGSQIPGNLEIAQVPQMITLSFNGAINIDNIPIYREIFADGKLLVDSQCWKIGHNVSLAEIFLIILRFRIA